MYGKGMSEFIIPLVIPSPLLSTAALIPVSSNELPLNEEFAPVIHLSQRLQIIVNLLPGLVPSLISKPSLRRGGSRNIEVKEGYESSSDLSSLYYCNLEFLSILVYMNSSSYAFRHELRLGSQSSDRNEATTLSKRTVKLAKETLPAILLSASTL
jgi:hypothetical protein